MEESAGVAGGSPPDALEQGFGAAVLAVAAASWAALTLAEIGLFSRALFVVALISMSIGGVASSRRRGVRLAQLPPARIWLWAAALVAAGALTLFPAPDVAAGGADETVYVNLGALISHRGALEVADRLLTETPTADWPELFPRDRRWPHLLNRFDGGVQASDGDPRLAPNFFHLTPAWIAAVTALAGAGHVTWAVPIAALLSPLGLFLLVRRLVSEPAAYAASALLAVNGAHIWTGRLPLSEPLAALLVVSGLLFAAIWLDSRNAGAGFVAGVAFGLVTLDRIDAMLLVVPVAAALFFAIGARGLAWRTFRVAALPLGLLALQGLVHASTISRAYSLRVLGQVVRDRSLPLVAIAGLVFAAVLAAVVLAGLRRGRVTDADVSKGGLALVLLLVAWLVVRMGPTVATNPLTALMTLPGLLAGGAGLIIAARSRRPAMWLAIALFAISAIAFAPGPRDVAGLPRAFRRDVPVILPVLLLFQGCLLFPRGASRWRQVAGAVVAVVFCAWQLSTSSALVLGASARGARGALDGIMSAVPADALVVTDPGGPTHLDMALDFIEGRSSVAARIGAVSPGPIRGAVSRALAAGRAVAVVATAASNPIGMTALGGFSFAPAATTSFDAPIEANAWPASGAVEHVELVAYRVGLRARVPWHVAIGEFDLGTVMAGWHGPERMTGIPGRWTEGRATLALPPFECAGHPALQGTIRLASLRPAFLPQPRISLRAGDEELLQIVPRDSAFHVYALHLSDALTARLCDTSSLLTLSTETFVPKDDAGLQDDRLLGVAVAWLAFEPSMAPDSHD